MWASEVWSHTKNTTLLCTAGFSRVWQLQPWIHEPTVTTRPITELLVVWTPFMHEWLLGWTIRRMLLRPNPICGGVLMPIITISPSLVSQDNLSCGGAWTFKYLQRTFEDDPAACWDAKLMVIVARIFYHSLNWSHDNHCISPYSRLVQMILTYVVEEVEQREIAPASLVK